MVQLRDINAPLSSNHPPMTSLTDLYHPSTPPSGYILRYILKVVTYFGRWRGFFCGDYLKNEWRGNYTPRNIQAKHVVNLLFLPAFKLALF